MSKVITPQENPEEHSQAMGFVQKYQETKKENSIDAHFISKADIQQFWDNPEFDAFKVHHARADEGTRTIIFEGLNAKGESLNSFVCELPDCPPKCEWSS
ncbi:MAG: hypothetical protein U5N85_12005 [Arcicella sp.]|nr:hypothetical protein [Arcicella sp.]